jgi:exodeoxyribonuclease V
MKIEPKNPEQEKAIKDGIEFLENGSPDEWLVIGGKAGTGKTTIAQAILEPYIDKKCILVCALSHKAKLVISEKLVNAFGSKAIISKSIAGALGMKMDQETGKFVIDKSLGFDPPIKKAKIIIVDEGSMINEQAHQLIMAEKSKRAKVIYIGDIRQLPPIREEGSKLADKPAPIFYGSNYVVLKERIRQGEESPILPFADFFGDNSRLLFPTLNPANSDCRKNIVNEKGALVFADNIYEVIETVLPLYQYAVDNKNMNIIKTITYRNDTRKRVNDLVREHIFGRNAAKEYNIGELLMFQDNYNLIDLLETISNSYEIQVTNVTEDYDDYKIWILEFIHEKKPTSIKVLDESEKIRHADDVTKKFQYAKSLPYGTLERSVELNKAWALRNRFAPVEYAYAITSHKSQGSTYNTVVVDERDIMNIKKSSNKSKSQSMYTALTRASNTCIVIDGQPVDETLEKAIDFSLKALET